MDRDDTPPFRFDPDSPERGQPADPRRVRVAAMTLDDVAEVGRVERRCFSNPWPVSAYRRELQAPAQNHYLVLRREATPTVSLVGSAAASPVPSTAAKSAGPLRALPRRTLLPIPLPRRFAAAEPPPDPIIGFAGMWVMYDEAHLTTIGIETDWRGHGLGELLLVAMFGEALRRRAEWLTLEVRVSNEAAQNLYAKYGMVTQGRRRRYYSDNNEDALIMWSRALREPAYQAEIADHRGRLLDRLGYAPAGLAEWPGALPAHLSPSRLRSAAS